MEREKIRETLDELARGRGAGDGDLWPRVEGQVRYRTGGARQKQTQNEWLPLPQSRGRVTWPKRAGFNLGLAGVMIAVVALFGGVALALGWVRAGEGVTGVAVEPVSTAGIQSGTPDRASTPVATAGTAQAVRWSFAGYDNIYQLSDPVGVSQKKGQYSVTLDRAYADANSIVVFYSAESENGARLTYVHSEKQLTLPDGSAKPVIHEDSALASTSGPGGVTKSGRSSHLMAFDGAAKGDLPDRLGLTLALHVIDADEYDQALSTVISSSTSPEEASGKLRALAEEFSFSFEVPVTKVKTRILDLNQSVEVKGETLTLERVVITPAEFRATVRYDKSAEDADKYIRRSNMWLMTGDPAIDSRQQVPPMSYGHRLGAGEDKLVHMIIWPFADLSGEWALNVYGLELAQTQGTLNPSSYPPPKAITGPWEFKFTVPPVDE